MNDAQYRLPRCYTDSTCHLISSSSDIQYSFRLTGILCVIKNVVFSIKPFGKLFLAHGIAIFIQEQACRLTDFLFHGFFSPRLLICNVSHSIRARHRNGSILPEAIPYRLQHLFFPYPFLSPLRIKCEIMSGRLSIVRFIFLVVNINC